MQVKAKIDDRTARAVKRLAQRVCQREPRVGIVIFGSRARGDHSSESDVDIAVILDRMDAGRFATARGLADDAFDILLDTGVLVAPLPLTREEWDDPASFSNPGLIHCIRTEGIALLRKDNQSFLNVF